MAGEDYFHLERLMPAIGDIRRTSEKDWRFFLKSDLELGRHDRIVFHAMDSPHTASMSAYERAILLSSLIFIGRGDLLTGGRLQLKLGEGESGLFAQAAACLIQSGNPAAALDTLSSLARNQKLDEYALRYLLMAAHQLDKKTFDQALGYARTVMPKPWVTYEALRYGVGIEGASAIGVAGRAAIRREKHVARYYPFTPDQTCLEPSSDRPFAKPVRDIPDGLPEVVKRVRESAEICARDPSIAEALSKLEAVRSRYAPEVPGPIQIISTGRAGTTAVYQWLDGSAYLPFHSFSWQLPPVHRWGLGARLVNGDVGPDSLMPFVKAYLFLRLPELISAYRAGSAPVIVSHWDSVFAPISMALFGSRITYFKRDPANVMRSMVIKRQYACAQIASLPYSQVDGGYEFDPNDFSAHWGNHIAWYLAFTEKYWEAVKTAFPNDCLHAVESDGLFRGQSDTIRLLHETFPLRSAEEAETRRKFSVPINVKSDKNVKVTEATESVLADALASYDHLSKQ